MYNCLYHVSSVRKAVSLLDASRLVSDMVFFASRSDTQCVYNVYLSLFTSILDTSNLSIDNQF